MALTKGNEVEIATIEQSKQTVLPGRHAKEWHRAGAIGAYLACIVVLFAAYAARVDLKAALWGFGLLHVGCTLSVLILWWQERQRGTTGTPQQSLAGKAEKEAGAILAKHAVSEHQ